MAAFIVFNRKSARMAKSPFITIQKRGNFSMNVAAAQMIAGESGLQDGIDVELLYDPDEKVVGIRRTENDLNAYTVRKQPSSESYILAGKAFTEYWEIDTTVARRYRLRELGEEIFGFSLNDQSKEVERGDKTTDEDD